MKNYFKTLVQTIFLVLIFAFTGYAQNTESEKALIEERLDKALQLAQDELAKKPKDIDRAYSNVINVLIAQGKYDEALTYTDKMKEDATKLASKGKVMAAQQNWAEAEKLFAQAMDEDDDIPEELYQIGSAYALDTSKVHIEKGIKYLRDAEKFLDKKKKPRDLRIYVRLGEIYQALNNASEAVNAYKTALELEPVLIYPKIQRAVIYEPVNKKESEKVYKDVLAADPQNVSAIRALSSLYWRQNQPQEAIEYSKKLISIVGETPDNLKLLASRYYTIKDYNSAIATLDKIIATNPNDAFSYRLMGNAYLNMEDSSKAAAGLQAFEKYFSIQNPDEITSGDYEKYGKLHDKLKSDSLASLAFEKAFSLDTSKIELLSDIADSKFKRQDWASTINYLELKKSKDVNAMTIRDMLNLGRAYYFDSTFDKASAEFEALTKLKPDYHGGWMWLARANTQKDIDASLGLAKPYYEEVIALSKKDPLVLQRTKRDVVEAYQYIITYYWNLKDKENMKLYSDELALIEPENELVKEVNAELTAEKAPKNNKAKKK